MRSPLTHPSIHPSIHCPFPQPSIMRALIIYPFIIYLLIHPPSQASTPSLSFINSPTYAQLMSYILSSIHFLDTHPCAFVSMHTCMISSIHLPTHPSTHAPTCPPSSHPHPPAPSIHSPTPLPPPTHPSTRATTCPPSSPAIHPSFQPSLHFMSVHPIIHSHTYPSTLQTWIKHYIPGIMLAPGVD